MRSTDKLAVSTIDAAVREDEDLERAFQTSTVILTVVGAALPVPIMMIAMILQRLCKSAGPSSLQAIPQHCFVDLFGADVGDDTPRESIGRKSRVVIGNGSSLRTVSVDHEFDIEEGRDILDRCVSCF